MRHPNLITYSEVVLALLHSIPQQHDESNMDDGVSRVRQLLVEMQRNKELFGGSDGTRVSDLLLRIRQELLLFVKRDPTKADELMK